MPPKSNSTPLQSLSSGRAQAARAEPEVDPMEETYASLLKPASQQPPPTPCFTVQGRPLTLATLAAHLAGKEHNYIELNDHFVLRLKYEGQNIQMSMGRFHLNAQNKLELRYAHDQIDRLRTSLGITKPVTRTNNVFECTLERASVNLPPKIAFTVGGKPMHCTDLARAEVRLNSYSVLPFDNNLIYLFRNSDEAKNYVYGCIARRGENNTFIYQEAETQLFNTMYTSVMDEQARRIPIAELHGVKHAPRHPQNGSHILHVFQFRQPFGDLPPLSFLTQKPVGETVPVEKLVHDKMITRTGLQDVFKIDENNTYVALPGLDFDQRKSAILSAFYELAVSGDAATATQMCTALTRAGYLFKQVDGDGEDVGPTTRPDTFQRPGLLQESEDRACLRREPPAAKHRRTSPLWNQGLFMIDVGYRAYKATNKVNMEGESDNEDNPPDTHFTDAQSADFIRRNRRIDELHTTGYLLTRVAHPQELKDCVRHYYPRFENPTLSATLRPKKGSLIDVELFRERPEGIMGFILDPHNVAPEDFGCAYRQDAGTDKDGFIKQKARRHEDIAATKLDAVRDLFEKVEVVGKTRPTPLASLSFHKRQDNTGWDVGPVVGSRVVPETIWRLPHNEITYYRGAERSMIVGLFIKGHDLTFGRCLRRLIKIQDLIRSSAGWDLPIRLDGSPNEFHPLIVDTALLSSLGLLRKVVPPARKTHVRSVLATIMAKAKLSPEALNGVIASLDPSSKLAELVNLQLMSLNLATPFSSISWDRAGQNPGQLTERFRFIDNLHLVFPGNFATKNLMAIRTDLILDDNDIALIKSTPPIASLLRAIMIHNMERFLGVNIDETEGISFCLVMGTHFNNQHDYRKGDFMRAVTRGLRSLLCLGFINTDQSDEVYETIKISNLRIEREDLDDFHVRVCSDRRSGTVAGAAYVPGPRLGS